MFFIQYRSSLYNRGVPYTLQMFFILQVNLFSIQYRSTIQMFLMKYRFFFHTIQIFLYSIDVLYTIQCALYNSDVHYTIKMFLIQYRSSLYNNAIQFFLIQNRCSSYNTDVPYKI